MKTSAWVNVDLEKRNESDGEAYTYTAVVNT
jgi:hypothetical protein